MGVEYLFLSFFFWPQREVSLSTPRFYSMHSDSACPQSFFTMRDAGFEPGTTASLVWSIINDQKLFFNYLKIFLMKN